MDVIECSSINTGAAGGLLNQAALVGMQDIENCLNVLPWIPHIYIVGCSVFRKKKYYIGHSFIHSSIPLFWGFNSLCFGHHSMSDQRGV